MARWAVFDVDGTLLPGTSMERLFWKNLLQKKQLPLKNVVYFLFKGTAALFTQGYDGLFKRNKSYLRGLSVKAIRPLAEDCYRQSVAPALSADGKAAVEALRQQGYKILIMSGAPDLLACHLTAEYHPDLLICARMDRQGERYTGKILELHPYGRRKLLILEGLREKQNIDFAASVAFADHRSDIAHLRRLGRAVAVNPTPGLRRYAEKHGWEIALWR